MNRSAIITLSALFFILVLVFLYYLQVRKDNRNESFNTTPAATIFLSDVVYTDIDGNNVRLESYAGAIVIAVTWASWCPQCVKQLNILDEIAKQETSVSVLAFNRAEPRRTAQDFLAFYNLDTAVKLVMDPSDNFFTSIGGRAMPETVIFNEAGEIVHHERDLFTKEEALAILQSIQVDESE